MPSRALLSGNVEVVVETLVIRFGRVGARPDLRDAPEAAGAVRASSSA
nr:hypothetical protein OG781_10470 [Streptomyces sp. NBC_00830]